MHVYVYVIQYVQKTSHRFFCQVEFKSFKHFRSETVVVDSSVPKMTFWGIFWNNKLKA